MFFSSHKIQRNVRFSPKATELLRGSEMTRCADFVAKSRWRFW
jgi:hypothetical protein